MWSKIISWILAALTALFNGFGMFQNTQNIYAGDVGYAIQEEAVDYRDMRSWYINSFGGGETCQVVRRSNAVDHNSAGFAYIVKGQPHNPDAKLEFVEGAVLVAPSRCKVTSQPDASGNKLTVSWDSSDYLAFRMEIINPGKWFCCEGMEPSETGIFIHSMEDHRITLEQGDTIAVCGPDTKVNLWRGDAKGALAKVETLREFLLYDSSEKGDSSQLASGDLQAPDIVNEDSDFLELPESKMWTGSKEWRKDDIGWWVGNYGAGNYPADMYMEKGNYYYYFNSSGYMLEGWGPDNRYYFTLQDSMNMCGSAAIQGAMARSTIVPARVEDNYVYVNSNGKVVEKGRGDVEVRGQGAYAVTYDKQGDSGFYMPRSGDTPVVNPDKNSGGSNSSTQGHGEPSAGNVLSYSEDVYDTLLSEGELVGNTGTGWVIAYDERLYVKGGKLIVNTPHDKSFSGSSLLGYNIDGKLYVFYEDGQLFTDWEILRDGSELYLNQGLDGLLIDGWKQWEDNEDGDWYYAIGSRGGVLHTDLYGALQSTTASGEVVFYLFDANGAMRTDEGTVIEGSHTYEWRGSPYGSYDRVD